MADSAMPPLEEYRDGQILTLDILPESTLRVRIKKLHTHTLSSTMVVDILDENDQIARTAFLKLFDRRFATDLREEYDITDWKPADEDAYIEAVENNAVDEFVWKLHHIENYVRETEDDWDDAQCEIFLADMSDRLYEAEVATYKALTLHQGRHIPRLLATVELDITPAKLKQKLADTKAPMEPKTATILTDTILKDINFEDTTLQGITLEGLSDGESVINASTDDETIVEEMTGEEQVGENTIGEGKQASGAEATPSVKDLSGVQDFRPFVVKGVLLEYIEGYNMWDMLNHFPQSAWQGLVDQAVKIVDILSDYSILNDDVKPGNYIVAPAKGGGEPRVYMIDFGCCRFRREDESDKDWGWEKNCRNEDGAIALLMRKRMKEQHGFDLVYQCSPRFMQWGEWEEGAYEAWLEKEATKTVLEDGTICHSFIYLGKKVEVGAKCETSPIILSSEAIKMD